MAPNLAPSNVWYLVTFSKWALGSVCVCNVLFNHVLEAYTVNGRSMNPTLSPTIHETGQRDVLLVKKWSPSTGLQRGDLVCYRSPQRPESEVIKRVIALGGDTVILDPKRRPGYGRDVLKPAESTAAKSWDSYNGKFEVPYGHIWAEGDNRENSTDSNGYGPVSRAMILGKPLMGLWPPRIFASKPWTGYDPTTKVKTGREVLPQMWLD